MSLIGVKCVKRGVGMFLKLGLAVGLACAGLLLSGYGPKGQHAEPLATTLV